MYVLKLQQLWNIAFIFYIHSRYLIFRSHTNEFINQNFVIHLIFILTTTVSLKSRYLDKIYHIIEAWFIYILFVTIVTRMNIMQMLTLPRVWSREYHSCPPPSSSPTPPQTWQQTRSCRYCCPGQIFYWCIWICFICIKNHQSSARFCQAQALLMGCWDATKIYWNKSFLQVFHCIFVK